MIHSKHGDSTSRNPKKSQIPNSELRVGLWPNSARSGQRLVLSLIGIQFGFAINVHVIANHLVICASAGVPVAGDSLISDPPLSIGGGS